MKHIIVSLLMIMGLIVRPADADEARPASYIVAAQLNGEDARIGTAVVRNNAELPPRLMMPLLANDEVFLRDPTSRIDIEGGNGETITVGADRMRVKISGEIDTHDSTWGIIAAIGKIIAGDDEQAPENMVAKGGDLQVPMALRSGNLLLHGRRKLWLGWSGGEAPFAVSLSLDGAVTDLASGVAGSAADLALPEAMPERFTLVVRDARQHRIPIRFRFSNSPPPASPGTPGKPGTVTAQLAQAAFLTGEQGGAWTVEAAQMLKASEAPAAQALLVRIQAGWKLK